MRYLRFAALLGICLFCASFASAQRVIVGVGPAYVGPAPVCAYGYYDYYPYACAPYGYYGPDWFVGGVFIGAGPWFHGFYGRPGFYGRGFYGRGYYGRGFYGGRSFGGRGWDHDGFRGRGFEHEGFGHRGFRGDEFHGGGGFHGRGDGFRGDRGFHGGVHGGGFHGGGHGGHR
jgi:hypothetical protein